MEINKSLKSEQSIILSIRKKIVIFFIILLVFIFGSNYLSSFMNQRDIFTIYQLVLIIYAFLCGQLYNVISKNIILSMVIGILIIVLSWFALGIGTFLLTIYLFVKSSTILKKLDEGILKK